MASDCPRLKDHKTSHDPSFEVLELKLHNINSILEIMLQSEKQLAQVSKDLVQMVIKSFFVTVEHLTKKGELVDTELFKSRFLLQGGFYEKQDWFKEENYHLKLEFVPGTQFDELAESSKLKKQFQAMRVPKIEKVIDTLTGSTDSTIESGGVILIFGDSIQVEGTHQSNGVHLISNDGSLHHAEVLVENKPTRLKVIVPNLPTGDYRLQVTTQYAVGQILDRPRVILFPMPLRVV